MADSFAPLPVTPGPYAAGYGAWTPPVAVASAPTVMPMSVYQSLLDQLHLSSQSLPAAPVYAAPIPAPPVATGLMDLPVLGSLLQRLGDLVDRLFFPSPAPTPAPPGTSQPAGKKTSFVISSFNVLGSNHTAPGGDAKGYASGVTRIRWAAELLRQKGVDIVGFQELAPDQAQEFKRVAGDTYGLYPGKTKMAMGSQNSIAWRKDQWDLVEGKIVRMPSHRGNDWPAPIVKLRNKETGQEAYFLNFHNAPGYRTGAQQAQRDKAAAKQVELVNRLKRESGLPVIVTGDMNDKIKYFNAMTQGADMNAANERKDGRPPAQMGIDWIFGSQQVKFSGYKRERGELERKTSDHAMIYSRATLGRQ